MKTLAEQIEDARNKLAADIVAFQLRHDMPDSTFGRLCMRDPAFLYGFRKGRKPSVEKMAAISKWMMEYRGPLRRRAGSTRAAA